MPASALGGRRSSKNFPSQPVTFKDGPRQNNLLFFFTDWNTLDRSRKCHTNLSNAQVLPSCVWFKKKKKGLVLAPCVSATKDTLSLFLSPYVPSSRCVSPKFSEVNVLAQLRECPFLSFCSNPAWWSTWHCKVRKNSDYVSENTLNDQQGQFGFLKNVLPQAGKKVNGQLSLFTSQSSNFKISKFLWEHKILRQKHLRQSSTLSDSLDSKWLLGKGDMLSFLSGCLGSNGC